MCRKVQSSSLYSFPTFKLQSCIRACFPAFGCGPPRHRALVCVPLTLLPTALVRIVHHSLAQVAWTASMQAEEGRGCHKSKHAWGIGAYASVLTWDFFTESSDVHVLDERAHVHTCS